MNFFTGPVTRYSRFVIVGRNFLWLLIALIVVALVWIASREKEGGARLVFTPAPVSENLQNEMIKPFYQGLDANNNPYKVMADRAVQQDKDTVLMENIRADMQLGGGAWVALNAGSGTLKIASRQLSLTGLVSIFYEGGYEFVSDHVQVDIGKGTAYGDSPVTGQGPTGTLKANGFAVEKSGAIIRFNGSVKMTLYR